MKSIIPSTILLTSISLVDDDFNLITMNTTLSYRVKKI